MEKSYTLESFGLEEEIAILTYLEMPEDRRDTETGKAILSFLKKYGEYIVNLYIKKQDVKILKKVLELQLVSRKELRNIFFIDGRENRGQACRQWRDAVSSPTMNN